MLLKKSDIMAKMTKSQKRKMIDDIQKKANKLYFSYVSGRDPRANPIVTPSDLIAIDKICSKWRKRLER